ncbi:MAG: hypothetical protein AAB861_00520 [Patescibacteria group bacterium]
MNKNVFQDVVPPERRSIRNIPIMSGRRKKEAPAEAEIVPVDTLPPPAFPSNKPKFPSGKVFAALAGLVLIGFIFGMMTVFTSASVKIVPKKEELAFNLALMASNNALPLDNNLKFEIIEIKKEAEKKVPTKGEEMVEKKAYGTIIVYNNFSKENQRLITRTRFETPEGLIFRIVESITIPGKTATGPGQIETLVYADEASEKYNIGKTDFSIPGFKNDATRFSGFYAKSKTTMTGGFVGKMKKIAEADKKLAVDELQNSVRVDLEKELSAKIPSGFTALEGSSVYQFNDLGQIESGGLNAMLKIEGVARMAVFDKNSLASIIAKEYLKNWNDTPVEIRKFDDITVIFDAGFDIFQNSTSQSIPLKLNGAATVFAVVNGIAVAEALKDLPKNDLNSVMAKFPGVSSAKATVRPFWKKTFPSSTAKIHINVE